MSAPPQLDRCPGLLRPFVAEDGAMVRLRIPGGHVRVDVLGQLLAAAEADGAAMVQLTSRGNLQVRALPDPLPQRFVDAVEATGLLPSATHERVRNILASPLAADLAPLVAELDASLVAEPDLAQLSGRFLFAVADATGSVLTEPYDLAWQSLGGADGLLLAAGRAVSVSRDRAATELIARAREFLTCRASASVWNVRDLPGEASFFSGLTAYQPRTAPPLVPGPLGADLVAGVPLAYLTSTHVQALAEVTDRVVLTPWRSLVVPGGAVAAARLATAGLVVQADSPWSRLSACTGAPACARGRCATTAIAADVAASRLYAGAPVHVVGCERRCGSRPGDLVAVAPASAADVLAVVEHARR